MQLQKLFFLFLYLVTIFGWTTTAKAEETKKIQAASIDECLDGETQQGFLFPIASGDLTCEAGIKICVDGMWQGPELFPTCENFTKSCDGSAHGTVISGYLQPTSPCIVASKTCLDGMWTGPEVYSSCTEEP